MPGFLDQILFEEEAEHRRDNLRRLHIGTHDDQRQGEDEAQGTTGLAALADAAATTNIVNIPDGIGRAVSVVHSRQSSVSTPSLANGASSQHTSTSPATGTGGAVLYRDQDAVEWTTGQKRRFAEYATSLCDRYQVPDEKRQGLIERSQLSTHDLLITIMVSDAAGTPTENKLAAGRTFIGSEAYKVHCCRSPCWVTAWRRPDRFRLGLVPVPSKFGSVAPA